jgi:peptidyl-prolyl cis-trans isomerase D
LIEEHLLQSSYVPPALLKTLVEVENEKRKVDIYKIESRTVSQVPEPTDTELQQYYQDHKDNFNAPEFREVSYALIGLENIEKIEVSEEEVEAELKQNESTQQAKVDSKQPQRIFKQFASDTKEEAQAVLKSLKEDGAEWGVQTASTTLDAVQARTGKMRAEDFEPEVAKSLFALEVGEISEVIETPLGFQIFQLDEIIKPVSDAQSASVEQDKKEQEKVRNEIRKSITQAKQEEALYAMIEKIEDELAGRVELAEITGKYGLKLEKTGRINYQGISADGSQASVPQYTQFLSRAFEIEEKAPPAMFEMAPNVFAIIRLDSLEKERSRALDEVRGFVSTAWQEYKRGEMVKEKAEGLAASVADITKATDHQPSSRNVVLSRDGSGYHDVLPPSLIEEIFSLAVGKVSRAHLRVNGDYFVAKVTAIGESRTLSAEVMEKSVKRITEELKAESSSIKLSEFISSLNKRYGVSINQAVLDAYQAKDE